MSSQEYHLINAFTDSPDSGNPAAVVILPAAPNGTPVPSTLEALKDVYPADESLQRVAKELDQPMTAFVLPFLANDGVNATADGGERSRARSYGLRWFNPVTEAWLCGHATMATSAKLFALHPELDVLEYTTMKHGILRAKRITPSKAEQAKQDQEGVVEGIQIAMDFPEITDLEHIPFDHTAPHGGMVWRNILQGASRGTWNWDSCVDMRREKNGERIVIELKAEYDLGMMKMDCKALAPLGPKTIIFTQVAGTTEDPIPTTSDGGGNANDAKGAEHIRSRVFVIVPGFEHEDHVTGSAHCLVVPYFQMNHSANQRLRSAISNHRIPVDDSGNISLRVRQVSPRTGDMIVTWRKAEGKVRIAGRCVGVKAGNILL